jgi:hypothetical protein
MVLGLYTCVSCGDAQYVQQLLRRCDIPPWKLDEAVEPAANGGHIPISTMLFDLEASLTTRAFQASSTVAVLQRFAMRGCSVDSSFLMEAAVRGRLSPTGMGLPASWP